MQSFIFFSILLKFSENLFSFQIYFISLQKEKMKYDLFESISQRSHREKDSENRRIAEIADEIRRRSSVYEAESGFGEKHVSLFEAELRSSESYAKEYGMWIPMSEIFDLGMPGESGNENDIYTRDDTVFKVNNLLNSGSITRLLDKIIYHNSIFLETFYYFVGFAGYEGRSVMPVLRQDLVKNARPATQIMIDTYMAAIGFTKVNENGRFANGEFEVWDLVPRNVLQDCDGDIYVVDAEIKKNEITNF